MKSNSERVTNKISIKVNIWQPRIGDVFIKEIEQLHSIIDKEYPGIKRNPQFYKLLNDAELHLYLALELQNKERLRKGYLTHLAKETRRLRTIDTQLVLVTAYVKNARRPRLYRILENTFSRTQALVKITDLNQENNGICSVDDTVDRLKTYYHFDDLAKLSGHQHRLIQVEKYFHAIELFKEGGTFADIAREIGKDRGFVRNWLLNASRPDLINLARQIPSEKPELGYKWLPRNIKAGHGFEPTKFLQVPVIIKNWDQIRRILNLLTPLLTEDVYRWRQQFGVISKEQAFAYILGMMVSDASKPKNSHASTGITLRLSKSYDWSKRVIEASCFYLSQLGISFSYSESELEYLCVSGVTPVITWIMRSCLNMGPKKLTTYDPITADWLIDAPYEIRLMFLQSINDGDGYASTQSQVLGNACGPNNHLVMNLLKTFVIISRGNEIEVVISNAESLLKAIALPFFLHATGRQVKAEKVGEMIKLRAENIRQPIPDGVSKIILKLLKKGKSCGEIAETIFDKYGLSYAKWKIYYNIRKKNWKN